MANKLRPHLKSLRLNARNALYTGVRMVCLTAHFEVSGVPPSPWILQFLHVHPMSQGNGHGRHFAYACACDSHLHSPGATHTAQHAKHAHTHEGKCLRTPAIVQPRSRASDRQPCERSAAAQPRVHIQNLISASIYIERVF